MAEPRKSDGVAPWYLTETRHKGRTAYNQARREHIWRLRREGLTCSSIAKRIGRTKSLVSIVLAVIERRGLEG